MSRFRWIVFAWLISACVGGTPAASPSPEAMTAPLPLPPTVTPAPTLTPALSPSPSATVMLPPAVTPTPSSEIMCTAPPIPVPGGATRVAEGCLHVHLEAGQVWERDGFDLAADAGYSGNPPPCAAFFLTLSWNVTAGNGGLLRWTVIRQGVEETAGQGTSGTTGFGCGFYRLHNDGATSIDVDVRVAVDLMQ